MSELRQRTAAALNLSPEWEEDGMRFLWRFRAFVALWRTWRNRNRPGAPGLRERVAAVPRLIAATMRGQYDGMSRGRLAAYALALAYVALPIDIVPELVLAVLGLAEDALISVWLLGSFLDETERFLIGEGRSRVVPPSRGGAEVPRRYGT
jgi:uncharacterized membrane protein YkvA (DUF1232 family)